MPKGALQPSINAALAASGDIPLGSGKYRFYVLLGAIVERAYAILFTRQWWNSQGIIDNPCQVQEL